MLWGTLRQRIGGAVAADSDAYVEEFFKKTPEDPTWEISKLQKETCDFIQNQLNGQRRGIALVTAGATIAPLDAANETFVDLSSHGQEQQGPACAEYLLQTGYAVIFLHRQDSLQPFTRHFQKYIQSGAFMSMFKVRDCGLAVEGLDLGQQVKVHNTVQLYEDCKDRLLNISFTSVQQYLTLLRMTTQAMNAAKSRAIIVLAASVMKFYVPISTKQNNKPPSSNRPHQHKQGEFSVNFVRVPTLIRKIHQKWCPKAFLVTCKHQMMDGEAIEAAYTDLEKWGVDVVAGMYSSREMLLITEHEDVIVSCPEDEDINDAFASAITELHRNFRRRRDILEKGKQLLLLSAKFSMLKEKDLVNEDAMGNKNVTFGTGVKIRADRRSGEQAPVYELKHIFQNKTHCARAHVWEGRLEKDGDGTDNSSPLDVVIAFSPAGTAETIRDVWGDFWSGWAEKEINDFKEQMSTISLSSALNVVTSSISGDYTPASALLQFMWSKVGSAWSEGEQTRIRQSIQNMIAVALNRGLTEPAGQTPLEKLMRRPRVQRVDSLAVGTPPSSVHSHSRRRRRDSDEDSGSNPVRLSRARKVRVHRAVNDYMQDMIEDGLLDAILKYVEQGAAIHVTGYSMGGMLGQLLMLYLGDRARINGWDTSKISFVGFGSPRVGDAGFAARLRVLFDPEQLLIVMHPSDTVHAFPPTAEGYADSAIKIFLKADGLGVGRRTASQFSLLPITKSIDRIFERAFTSSRRGTVVECGLCGSVDHSSEQHRCRYCIERGSHRGADCPNRSKPCLLCGHANHCTGEHRCRVCQQFGHRGRECHAQRDVGVAELVTYFRFHHFLYYNSNLKKSVEFTTN